MAESNGNVNEELFVRLKRRSNKPGNMTRDMGLTVTDVRPGIAEGDLFLAENSVNPRGIVHGGTIFGVMDQLGGLAACTTGYGTVTINGSIDFLRPVMPRTPLKAVAEVVKPGRRFTICEAKILSPEGKLLAKGSFTYCMMEPLEGTLKLTGD